jgi:hypothetical protein
VNVDALMPFMIGQFTREYKKCQFGLCEKVTSTVTTRQRLHLQAKGMGKVGNSRGRVHALGSHAPLAVLGYVH